MLPQTTVIADIRSQARHGGKRSAHRTIFNARQRLTSNAEIRASLDFALMQNYAQSRITSALPLTAIVIILSIIASFWIPDLPSALWGGAVSLTLLIVVLIVQRFRNADPAQFHPTIWTHRFVAAEMLHGLAWSTLALFPLVTTPNSFSPVMFAMVLVGIAANAVTTHSLPSATLVNTLPVTVSISTNFIFLGGTLNYTLAVVTIFGEIFFVYLAHQMRCNELETISHQTEKDALISELEEAQQMSEEARRHAEQANIAKSQFLATMSHELRTPLNAIIGFSEVLKSELLGPHHVSQYKDYANDIHDSGQHLLTLINEILDLSRIEAGKYELSEEAVSLIDIADDCRRMMELRARSKGIELVFTVGKNLSKIWADSRAIRQIILNLLSNAIKFTPQNGRIILLITRNSDGGQIISVKDNGPGIPQEEIETILSSFGQGSLAQKTAEQGAGLGLPIVQRMMELHQGRFDLFSKVRFGTEVIATFPQARVLNTSPPDAEKHDRLEMYSKAG